MFVDLSPHFKRAYRSLPSQLQADFEKKIQIFIKDPRHPSLKIHKLKGQLQECLAFRLMNGYRVLFEFSGAETVHLLDVGPHDMYKKR